MDKGDLAMKHRRRARVMALQTLFEVDSVNHPPEEVLNRHLESGELPKREEGFARGLVEGVLNNLEGIDAIIGRLASEWPLEQMAIVDRNVLRIGVYEMVAGEQVPMKVAINEAVELAKLFGSDSSRRFVNGVLGALARDSYLLGELKTSGKGKER